MTPILLPEDFAHPEIKNRIPPEWSLWTAGFCFGLAILLIIYVLAN